MTLIVIACSGTETVMVSDRLVSSPKTEDDPDASKGLVVQWPGGRLLVGITGLARLERPNRNRTVSFDTREWLAQEFQRILLPTITMEDLLKSIRISVTNRFRRFQNVPVADKELTIVCAGYKYVEDRAIPGCATISNSDNLDGTSRDVGQFVVQYNHLPPGELAYALTAGNINDSLDKGMNQIAAMASNRAPSAAIAARSVDLIRAYADSKESKGVVGRDCSSSIMSCYIDKPVTDQYHSLTFGNRIHISETVAADPRIGEGAVLLPSFQIDLSFTPHGSTEPLPANEVFARSRPDGTCSCGSGKRYRRCHGDPSSTHKFLRKLEQMDRGDRT